MDIPEDGRFSGLLDAEVSHRADPWSFSIPRSGVRAALQPGDIVKLLFGVGGGPSRGVERMWVEVVEVGEDGYVGRLDNEPSAIGDLELGAIVRFEPRHVAAIWRDAADGPRPEDLAIVSDRIWDGGATPTLAVRLPGADGGFSGWILSAEGDHDVLPPDLAGYRPVTHEALTGRYRAFDSIEDEPPGTSWRWDPDALEWTDDPATAPG
jgi:hypothetical protein